MHQQLPPEISDPRPELTMCGYMVLEDCLYFLYDLRGNYLATDSNGNPLTNVPSDTLSDAIAAIAAQL